MPFPAQPLVPTKAPTVSHSHFTVWELNLCDTEDWIALTSSNCGSGGVFKYGILAA
jgi:hypothetical protein